MRVTLRRCRRGTQTEQGAVAIIVAAAILALLVVTAMVLDFGLARLDRQVNKSAADNAVTAGIRGFDGGDANVYAFKGVCDALSYLRANVSDLSSLPAWPSCTVANYTKVCSNTVAANQALYDSGYLSSGYRVWIRNPYSLPDNTHFPEDADALSLANETPADPCTQLAVIIQRDRNPGLGSVVGNDKIRTTIRSVGRVKPGSGDLAPALILLERTLCQVLVNGNSSPSNTSKIYVYGTGTMPASIHSDSDALGAGCGSGPNQQLLAGNKTNGIVAFSAPVGGLPGLISTYGAQVGTAANIVSDGTNNIFGTTAVNDAALPGTKASIIPRSRVGRTLVDERYLAGVSTAVRGNYSQWMLNHATPAGFPNRYDCSPPMGTLATMTSSDSVYIDCPSNSGITLSGTIGAGRIYFHGFFKSGTLRMPNATEVYIDNTDNSGAKINANALTLGNSDSFCIRTPSCSPSGFSTDTCSSAPTGSSVHSRLFVRRGMLNTTGGLLRLCNTTVYMEGGQLGDGTAGYPGGCLPTSNGTLPTTTPCVGATDPKGSGLIQLGGATDWTAPNQYASMAALSAADKQLAWDNGEDLALWDETYSDSPSYKMAGGASLNVSGVFMVPNAFPIEFFGNAVFDLRDAQFITRSFQVGGGAQLLMQVDPNNAISLPKLIEFTLVR